MFAPYLPPGTFHANMYNTTYIEIRPQSKQQHTDVNGNYCFTLEFILRNSESVKMSSSTVIVSDIKNSIQLESVKMSSSAEVVSDSKNNIQLESYPCICLFCATEHHPTNFAYFNGKLTRIKRDADTPSAFALHHNDNKESVIVVEHLRSIFILRHLLNLSEEICCGFLKQLGGQLEPDLWFSVCSTCEETVQQCYSLRNKIQELERSLGSLKSHLCNLVRESSWKNVHDGQDQLHINSICLDIRSHISPRAGTSSMSVREESPDKLPKCNSTPARSSKPKRSRTVRKSVRTKTDNKSFCSHAASTFPPPLNEPSIIETEAAFSFTSSSPIVDRFEESLPSPASFLAQDSDGSEWQPSENEGSLLGDDLLDDDVVVAAPSCSSTTARTRNPKKRKRNANHLPSATSAGPELETDCNVLPADDDDGINEEESLEACQFNITKSELSQKRKPARRRIRIRKKGTSSGSRQVGRPTKISKIIIVCKCDACPATFPCTEQLENHRELHDSGAGESCSECGWLLSSKVQLVAHKRSYHSKDKPAWKTDKEEIPYYCDHCHMIFDVRRKLIKHFNDAHRALPFNDCSMCELKLESKQLLKIHCQLEHDAQELNSNSKKVIEILDPSNPAEKPVLCSHCTETFSSKFKMDYHIAKCHKEVLLWCTQCKFKAKKFCVLQTHLYKHTKESAFVCEICCKRFNQSESLQYHIKQDHFKELGVEPIICKVCNLTFGTEKFLKIHMKGVHEKKKEKFCEYCGKGFVLTVDLKRHILLHTVPRELQYKKGPFTCEFCQAQFNVRQGLYYHVKKLHSDKFTLRCDRCRKGYVTRISLEKHQKSCK